MFNSDTEIIKKINECLIYNECTGVFTHKRQIAKGWPIKPGTPAGTVSKHGYLRISILGRQYMAHRLAWLFKFGRMPDKFIDHINGNRLDNRISNLRDVSKRVNSENRRCANKSSAHGWLGATYRPRQGWTSQIWVNGSSINLGFFDSPEEAHIMYLLAKKELHIGSTI